MTKKKVLYKVLEVLFYLIAPLIFIAVEFSNIGGTRQEIGFKIQFLGILLIIFLVIASKKLLLKKWLESIHQRTIDYGNDLKIETDVGKIENIKRELKFARTIECVFNAILPVLLLVLGVVACKGMEQTVVKLSGCLCFILVSYLLGTVASMLDAREVDNKEKRNER